MNIIPLYNTVIEKHIRVNGKFFKYKIIGRGKMNEGFIVNESLKEAFCLISTTYTALKKQDKNSLKIAGEILGSYNHKTLLNSIEKIGLKILNNTLVILRENYLDTENDNVLASVDKDDKKTFTVYDKFFDKLNCNENRAGIFIHEIAHLCNLDEEDEMKEIDSAECIKNICLCINGKIPLEQIKAEHKKEQQNPQKDREDGTLTYRPNPNRRNNGEFDFGPDRGSSSASGSGSSGENSGDEKSTSKKSSSGYKDDNFTLSSVGTNRTSDNNKVELEDCVKFGIDVKDGSEGVFCAIAVKFKDDSFTPKDKLPLVFDIEIQKLDSNIDDKTYDVIYNKVGETLKATILIEGEINENKELNSARIPLAMVFTKTANGEIADSSTSIKGLDIYLNVYLLNKEYSKTLNTTKTKYERNDLFIGKSLSESDAFDSALINYIGCHDDKNDTSKKEGLITNSEESKNNIKANSKHLYKRKVRIDIDFNTIENLD